MRRERTHQPVVQAELGEGGRRRLRRRRGGVQGQVKLGMRFGPARLWWLRVPGRGRSAMPGGAFTASAVAIRRRTRTPGTVGHAENSIAGSEVACSTDVNEKRRTAGSAGLFRQRPAGCSPAGVAAKIAASRCKATSRALYSRAVPLRRGSPARGNGHGSAAPRSPASSRAASAASSVSTTSSCHSTAASSASESLARTPTRLPRQTISAPGSAIRSAPGARSARIDSAVAPPRSRPWARLAPVARSVARAPARSRRQSDRSSPASGPGAEPTSRSSHRPGSSPWTCRLVGLELLHRVEVRADVVPDRGVRAGPGLHRADPGVRQHPGPAQEVGVLGGVDVVGHHADDQLTGQGPATPAPRTSG